MSFSAPKLPPAPQPVYPTSAAMDIDKAVSAERKRQASKMGRVQNILSSDYASGFASKTLGG